MTNQSGFQSVPNAKIDAGDIIVDLNESAALLRNSLYIIEMNPTDRILEYISGIECSIRIANEKIQSICNLY